MKIAHEFLLSHQHLKLHYLECGPGANVRSASGNDIDRERYVYKKNRKVRVRIMDVIYNKRNVICIGRRMVHRS